MKLNIKAFARAVLIQAKADIRPNLWGKGLFGVLLTVAFIVGISYTSLRNLPQVANSAVIGIVSAYAGFSIIQIASEIYSERVAGTLLRVRSLPHGPLLWAIGKTISATTLTLISQLVMLIAFLILFPSVNFTVWQVAALIVLMTLALFAHAPIGFISGAASRSTGVTLLAYLLAMALIATSGGFFPITLLPRWLQYVEQIFPTYWVGHLSRYLVHPGDATWEAAGSYQPLVALLVIGVWIVAGYALAAFIIKRSFRKESIGSLVSIQNSIRSQVGL